MPRPPDPLTLALAGDERALEQVLGGVVAPLFDLAIHLHQHPVRAELAALEALQELATAIRSGHLLHADPLVVAGRTVLQKAAGSLQPRSGAPPPASRIAADLGSLTPSQRLAVLAALALDVDGPDLAWALDQPVEASSRLLREGLHRLRREAAIAREELDEEAARAPLPGGLIDRALGR